MVIMQYINVFFSGFILSTCSIGKKTRLLLTDHSVRLPFPLTAGFKSLLSRDIPMADLDVRWVSWVLICVLLSYNAHVGPSALCPGIFSTCLA